MADQQIAAIIGAVVGVGVEVVDDDDHHHRHPQKIYWDYTTGFIWEKPQNLWTRPFHRFWTF